MGIKKKHFLLGIFFLVNIENLYAQIGSGIKDSLIECTEDAFVQGVAECFISKFEDLIPNAFPAQFSYSRETFNTGRHPLSENLKSELKDSAIRYNYMIPQMSKRLSSTHKNLLNTIYTAGQAALVKERQFMAIEKLKHMDLQEMVHKYIVEIMEHNISPYMERLSLYSSFDEINMDSKNDFCDQFCRFPVNTCVLCKIIVHIISNFEEPIECLSQFSETDFEDGLKWIKCLYNCEDLIPISGCIKDHFSQCGTWSVVGDVIIKGFMEFTDLGSCMINVVSERNITLEEGGESAVVSFHTYVPPTVHCVDFQSLSAPLGMINALGSIIGAIRGESQECIVQVQMSLQNYLHDILPHINRPSIATGRPKCHDKSALRQAVVGYHEYNNNTIETCVVLITEENWNETFNIPIWASVDLKNDGNITTDLALKLTAGGTVKHNERLLVEIVDKDIIGSTLCQSSGDPHITSFDGHYYNNMYEGYFYLYRNTFLPYQVQAIYQTCMPDGDASCTCAVAVKSGDDVFVVDRCRRTDQPNDDIIMRTVMFVNGDITPGTRVFNKNDGAEIQVLLPTGFSVTIVTSNHALSVYLNPSNYDFELTDGLCGYFDGDQSNDLRFANDTIYDGEGSEERGQPRPFIQAWRVPEEDRIFEGVAAEEEPDDIGRYCKCNHVVFKGVQCTCGPGEIVETCDMDLSGEITANLSALVRRSRKSYDGDVNIDMDDIDIDEDFVPPPDYGWGPDWDEDGANSLCSELILNSTNSMLRHCVQTQGDDFVEEAVWHCVEDIQITDNTDWQYSAVESAKRKCTFHYLRGIDLGYEYLDYANDLCLNDCTGNGECSNGTCQCNDDKMSGDCSLDENNPVVIMDDSSMCDTRTEDCTFATIFGKYFPPDGSLSCHLREATMKSGGFDVSDKNSETHDMLYVSPYQVACKLPKAVSYEITLEWNGDPVVVTLSGKPEVYENNFIFMVYDSACYDCSLEEETCTERGPDSDGDRDHCMISSTCYAPGQVRPGDDCRYCNNTELYDDWTWFTDETCAEKESTYIDEQKSAEREKIIRISVACILTVFIILFTIFLYIRNRKNQDVDIDKDIKPADGDVTYYTSTTGVVNDAMQMDEVKHPKIVPPQVQRVKDIESGHDSRLSSVSSIGSASDLEGARRAAIEKRKRTSRKESTSSSISVRSIGLGAAGPIQYSHYNKVVDDGVEHMRGMGGHGSPALPTRTSHHAGIHVNVAF